MTLEFIEILPMIMVFAFYFLGMPIVYALFGSTFFFFLFIDTTSQPWLILQKVMNATQSFSMLAIPFFIMSGSVMSYGGLSEKLMDFCECVTGHMKGGLAQVNVLLSMLMGGCSGSANADAAMDARMLCPEMEKRGYSKAFAAAVSAASSASTPVIPPGVNLVVYTLIAQASLGRTFAAGYVPGIMMTGAMMITTAIIAHKRNYPKTRDKLPPITVTLKQALVSFWGLFFPFGIIIGLRLGMFTPSEGGAFAVLYAFIVGKFVYKKLSLREHLIPILLESIAGTSAVVLIMVSANVFGQYLSWINLPKIVAAAILDMTSN
ncbi:MAG: TRAP transporter large permease, partial [Clostridia bacterium]|nr:TRAP transporter large permease [Clostridia bacterium]